MTHRTQKEIGLVVVALIVTAVLFWIIAVGLAQQPIELWTAAAIALGGSSWIALIAFTFALIRGAAATTLVVAAPLVVIAVSGLSPGAVVAALPTMAALALARWRIRDEIKVTIRFRPVRLFYAEVRWLILGLLIAAAGLGVPYLAAAMRDYTIIIPQAAIAAILAPATPFLATAAPGAEAVPTDLVTDIVNSYLATVIRNSPVLSAIAALLALLLIARLLIPFVAWPTLGIIMVLVLIARQTRLVYLVERHVTSTRLQLEE